MDQEIDTPDWTAILRAVQERLGERIHTSLPATVLAYDAPTQRCSVQLGVQLLGRAVPPLHDVPVVWPGGAAGVLHVPLEAGDSCLVSFSEEDFSLWLVEGDISPPAQLARHGLNAVAIPGLRHNGNPAAVTGGHVTLAASTHVRLGSDDASAAVALQTGPEAWRTAFDAWVTTLPAAGSPLTDTLFKAAMTTHKTALDTAQWPQNYAATKVKAK